MKTVLITGANKGIGLETAKQLSKKGFFVYMGSRSLEKGEAAVNELQGKEYENIKAIEIDVTDPDTIFSAKAIIKQERKHLDVLINNAGILGEMPQHATEVGIDNFKHVFDTNVYGAIRVSQAFIDLLKKAPQPRIVNVTSNVGSLTLQADPDYALYDQVKWSAYSASKAALNMYTINLAFELRELPFKVNAVCPGYTSTDFTDHNGTGTVEEAAERIVKYALIGENGPTGQFFSEDYNPETGTCPW